MLVGTRIDTLVGLHVTDDESYQSYRDGMATLLEAHGGSVRHDLPIGEAKGGVAHPMNRLFILSFPDVGSKQAFFQNEAYRQMQQRFFDPAVEGITTVTEYEMSEN